MMVDDHASFIRIVVNLIDFKSFLNKQKCKIRSLALSVTFIHILERIETAFDWIRVHSIAETDLMYDMSHIDVRGLYFCRMSGNVEISGNFVYLKLTLKSTANASVETNFIGIVNESDLMSAIFILNIESDHWIQI